MKILQNLIVFNRITNLFFFFYFVNLLYLAYKFQENLLRTMIQIENTYFELGASCKRNCLIICDRGVMDASAYIDNDKWERLKSNNNWNEIELRDNRYNQIVHMVSAANGAEDFYSIEVRKDYFLLLNVLKLKM